MRGLAAATGALILVVVMFDIVWTTISASGGAGPVTSRWTHRLWALARRLRGTAQAHRNLRWAGIGIVVLSILTWFLLLWVAWSLIFLGDGGAVVSADTGRPADLLDRIYFAGYTLTTLGNGSLTPGDGLWQMLTVVASFNGISVLTLGVTYLVPVISAVTGRRRMALHVSGLGTSPVDIVLAGRDGGDWEALERHLAALTPEFGRLGQQHLAYPVLHYFHDLERDAAIAVAVAVLDETLTLLEHGVAPEARPDSVTVRAARSSVSAFLGALTAALISPAEEEPPEPRLDPLRRAGVPTVGDAELRSALEDLAKRRRVLAGFVREDGWTWDAVVSGRPGEDEDRETARDSMQEPPADEDGDDGDADDRPDDRMERDRRDRDGAGGEEATVGRP